MSNFSLSRLTELYLKMQSDPLTLPSSIANANYCLFSKLGLDLNVAGIKRPDITGSRTDLPGTRGRMGGTWSYEGSLAGSGTVGTAPDVDPILQSVFGQAGAAAGSPVSSFGYALSDSLLTFALFKFRTPSTLTQQVGMGCIAKDLEVSMGADVA